MNQSRDENGCEKEKSEKTWGSLIFGLIGDIADNVSSNMGRMIRENQIRLFKKIAAFVLAFVGALFFLNGLAIFINEYIGRNSWIGYMVVGFVIFLIGMTLPKRS